MPQEESGEAASAAIVQAVNVLSTLWSATSSNRINVIEAITALVTPVSVLVIAASGKWMDRVLTFMREEKTDQRRQLVCCRALRAFASAHPAGKAAVLADERSVRYIRRAVEHHPCSSEVKAAAECALKALGPLGPRAA